MTLARVEYEFFESELPSSDCTELHRQIRFEFSDNPPLFLSWSWELQQTDADLPYSLAHGPASFFKEDAARRLDASSTPFWAPHLGRRIQLEWQSPDHQVLAIRSAGGVTFAFSGGRDLVEISTDLPGWARRLG